MATLCNRWSLKKHWTHILPVALVVSIGFGGAAWGLTGDQPDASSQPAYKPLQGGVEHDEKLPAIDPKFSLGATIDPNQMTSVTPDNSWFPIPAWFAGTWHSDEQKVLSLHDYQSGDSDNQQRTMKEVSDVVYGQQRDKSGQVWNYIKVPRTEKQKVSRGFSYLQAKKEEALQSDQSKVIIKYLYDQLNVNNKEKIQSVTQIQTINTYTQIGDDLVRLSASMKSFDADGNAKILQKGEKLAKRTTPYQEIDKDGDLDLKKLFAEFLTKTGRQDLIPD